MVDVLRDGGKFQEGTRMSTTAPFTANHWPDAKCARAFWGQREIPPYRRLLADTTAWLVPEPGQRWMDLGCGSAQLTRAIWEKSGGQVAEVVGVDCAAENALIFKKLRARMQPSPGEDRLRFCCVDFSRGLELWDDGYFDGVVSGLAIQYAESYSEEHACWTTDGYDRVLAEVHRVLRPGGSFIFSVNVPEPAWSSLALRSWRGFFQTRQPGRYLKRAWRMLRYGSWLKREARKGRFHYLPWATVLGKLTATGFESVEHRLTFARQAYLIRCRKAAPTDRR
jgi:SAM-dependent methyltransferase